MKQVRQFSKPTPPALVLGEIGLVHNVAEADIPVYVGSEIKDNLSLYSRYTKKRILFSDYQSSEFIQELVDLGKQLDHKIVLFSDDDHAILNITQHQDVLEPYYHFRFPPADMVKKLLDKQLFCDLIEQFDLPAPRSVTLSGMQDLPKITEAELTFPCVIKPSFKQAWWGTEFGEQVGAYQKALKVDSFDELADTYSDVSKINPYVVVQEFIEGGEDQIFSVNMLIGSHGNLKGYFIAQKLRTYPIKAGEGCYIITVKDDYMAEMALNIARKLGLQGLLNIQFKRDQRTGEPVLLEIHTRNSVWSYLGTAAGVNLAAEYYRDLVEPSDNPIPVYKSNVTMVLLEKDVKAFLQNLRERQISIPRWISSYFKKIVWGGFRWSDPKPVMMRIWFFIMRRIFGNEYFRTT